MLPNNHRAKDRLIISAENQNPERKFTAINVMKAKIKNIIHSLSSEAKPRLTFIPTSVQRNVSKPAPAGDSNGSDNPITPKSNDYFRQLLAKK